MNALPQKVSAVTVSEPVDATVKRKTRSDKGKPRGPRQPADLTHVRVDPQVMNAVRRIIREGKYTKPTIVDAETVVVR